MDSNGKLDNATVTELPGVGLRLDLECSVPPDHNKVDRYTAIVDLNTARAFAVLLIQSIERAEVNEARNKKGKKP